MVTGETIIGANVLEERHQAPRGQHGGRTERDGLLRTQPPEVARTEPNACRERGGTQTDGRRQEAHTAERRQCRERAHGGAHPSKIRADAPSARPEQQPRVTKPYTTRATAPSSTPIRTESIEQDTLPERIRCGAVFRDGSQNPPAALHAPRRPSSGARRVQRLQGLPVRTEGNAPERLRTERSSHRAQRTVRTRRVGRGH
jgi:hypothetical protein